MTAAKTALITGASHTGKSSLAKVLAERTSAHVISTDTLARHPGRPWPAPRAHVADYYRHLAASSQLTLLLHHYAAMQGLIREAMRDASGASLIVEGSAVRPDLMIDAQNHQLRLCLYAPDALIIDRIHRESDYRRLPKAQQLLVDAFLDRTLADQGLLRGEAEASHFELINVGDDNTLQSVTERAVVMLS